MNIFNKIILIFFVISSTHVFGLQRIRNILRQSIGSNNSRVQVVPELNVENIRRYPQFKEQFIKEAEENFLKYTVDKCEVLVQLVGAFKRDAAMRLAPLAASYFDKMPGILLIYIMSYYEESAKLFVEPALKNFKNTSLLIIRDIVRNCPDFCDLFMQPLLDNFEFKIHSDGFALNGLMRDLLDSKESNKYLLIPKLLKHFDLVDFDTLHRLLLICGDEYYSDLAEKILNANHRSKVLDMFVTEVSLKLFLNALLVFSKGKDYPVPVSISKPDSNGIEWSVWHTVHVFGEKKDFDKNYKVYLKLLELIKIKALENPTKYPLINLDHLYPYLSKEEQEKLKESLEPKEFKPSIAWIIKNIPNFDFKNDKAQLKYLNKFSSTESIQTIKDNLYIKGKETATKHHVFSNLSTIHIMLTKDKDYIQNKEKFKDPKVKEFLLNIYKIEKEEHAKGNYFFYHGRNKNIRFAGEIYKQLWKLKNGFELTPDQQKKLDQKLDNFIFMRFESKVQAKDQRDDYFFMNHSLFGNAHETTGASTLTGYWLRDHSAHFRPTDPFSTKSLFSKPEFKLAKYFEKYKNELDKLQDLHDKATEHGEIVAVSIAPDKLHLVKPCGPGGRIVHVNVINGDTGEFTTDAKTILDALSYDANNIKLKDGKSSDYLEWKLPLEDSYALDPINGPRFYSFYFMDEKSQKEYEDYRDEIFAKIKQDIENDKTSGVKKIISKL